MKFVEKQVGDLGQFKATYDKLVKWLTKTYTITFWKTKYNILKIKKMGL